MAQAFQLQPVGEIHEDIALDELFYVGSAVIEDI